jgi:hypothetical protein
MSNAYNLTQLNPSAPNFQTGMDINVQIGIYFGTLQIGSANLITYTPTAFSISNISVSFLNYTVEGAVSLQYNPPTNNPTAPGDNWIVNISITFNGTAYSQSFTAIPQTLSNWNGDAPSIQLAQVNPSNNVIDSGGYVLDIGVYTSWYYHDKIQFQTNVVPGCPVIGLCADS